MVNIRRFRKMIFTLYEKPRIIWKRMRLRVHGFKNTYKA